MTLSAMTWSFPFGLQYSWNPSTDGTLTARLEDPYWLLGRQWQLGEFIGEDAASPALMRHDVNAAPIDSISVGTHTISGAEPLELSVVGEPLPIDARTRIELGGALAAALAAHDVADAVADFVTGGFALAFAPGEAEELRSATGVLLDGGVIVTQGPALVAKTQPLPGALATATPARQAKVLTALSDTLTQATAGLGDGLIGGAGWDPFALRHRATCASGANAYTIDPSGRGEIDWYHFDFFVPPVVIVPQAVHVTPATSTPMSPLVQPARVRFPGAPNPRYWDFESGAMDLTSLDLDGRDLARLIVVDFMLVSSHDWFLVPLELTAGTVFTATSVQILDVFGDITTISPAHTIATSSIQSWSFFAHQPPAQQTSNATLVIAAPLVEVGDGVVLDDVMIQRDEIANLVWAAEQTYADELGRPQRTASTAAAPTAPARGIYELVSHVPDGVFPLLRQRRATATGLVRGSIAEPGETPPAPRTTLLAGDFFVAEHAIGDRGARLQRRVKLGRWHDGRVAVWTERSRTPAGGESRRDLRFDTIGR